MFSDLIDVKFHNECDGVGSVRIERIERSDHNYYSFEYPWKNDPFTERIYSTIDLEDAIKTVPNISIYLEATDEVNRLIDLDSLNEDITHERAFLEIHKCYILKIG